MNKAQRKMLSDVLKNTGIGILLGFGAHAAIQKDLNYAIISVVVYFVLLAISYDLLKEINDE